MIPFRHGLYSSQCKLSATEFSCYLHSLAAIGTTGKSPTLGCVFHLFQWNCCGLGDLWRQNPVMEKYCNSTKP